ncbi:hypothetical protein DDB_G0288833 [Dictyostelium discoideum AX4]|uniref:Probable derlin-1 homolog n=1 Tax=Dictyostelium discoideum TaxID=44689 RepID=DERL1_DICDI|nr:hypothetical protein DDB_G0288833 [Dictyostelium discoideum AX4]Q54IC9.1 RecName: Full=Probable derlin-1 homolog [Dictyostelium discoideum]EAL63038.1 hypothetical protein DDB_G0288833 [Dictyostelium discoideum AX4]|eukprot:XP_636548.1 hypothetical protein DDB_G0288833 [Dictyostelium discoideum AX4]
MDGVKEWFNSIPPVSRYMFAIFLGIPVLAAMHLISFNYLYLDFTFTFKHFHLWRLITAPCIISSLGPMFLFNLIFFYQYTTRLESLNYAGKSDDYLFCIIFISICNIIFGLIFEYYFLGTMTIMSLIYIYSRMNPTGTSNFYGFFSFKTIYLPWVFLVAHFLQTGHPPYSDFLAIVSGHIFFYLTDIYPRANGVPALIKTPKFITNIFNKGDRNPNNVRRDPRTGRPIQEGGYNWGQGHALG